MTIHHATIRKAEKLGYTLHEEENGVTAFWPLYNTRVFGASPQDAINQMEAVKQIKMTDDRVRIEMKPEENRLVFLTIGGKPILPTAMTPEAARQEFDKWVNENDLDDYMLAPVEDEEAEEQEAAEQAEAEQAPEAPAAEPDRSPSGVSFDGAQAYREGTPAADCPYDEGTDEAEQWWAAWDEAADAADEPKEEGAGGSVVSDVFRTRYAEAGHPTHCGDWLAVTVNTICQNPSGTNLHLFESICNLNGVSLAKLNRESKGWQGRFRMTGRNMLARAVFNRDGKLLLPETLGGEKQAPAEWLAAQKFKKPKAKAEATAETAA